MIILRSPKGWTGIKTLHGKAIEGSHRSHQVPGSDLKTNQVSLEAVENWLRSYHPEELFDEHGRPMLDILACCPEGKHSMGSNQHTLGGHMLKDLTLPDLAGYEV